MSDLTLLFELLNYERRDLALRARLRRFGSAYTGEWAHAMTVAPVIDEAAGFFQLHPGPDFPRSAWRWVLAVRQGVAVPDYSASGWRETALRHVRLGAEVVDLVACDTDLSRVTGRLVGASPVLGWPIEPAMAVAPVRVHRSLEDWIAAGGEGVVFIGTEAETQAWLRCCEPGVIAADLAHGEELAKSMRRPVPDLPPIMVRSAA